MKERLLRRREVEAIFGLKSKNTLTDWRKNGILIPIKIGGFDFYRESDIDALLNKAQQPQEHQTKDDDKAEHICVGWRCLCESE